MSSKVEFGDYKRIKEELLKGGVIYAPRRYGKTRALAEILVEHPDVHVIVHSPTMKNVYKEMIRGRQDDFFGLGAIDTFINEKVHVCDEPWNANHDLNKIKVFVDEFEACKGKVTYTCEIFAAVSSPSKHRVVVIQPTREEILEVSEIIKQYPETKKKYCI